MLQDNWTCDFSPAPGIAWIQAGAPIPTGLVSEWWSLQHVPERKLSVKVMMLRMGHPNTQWFLIVGYIWGHKMMFRQTRTSYYRCHILLGKISITMVNPQTLSHPQWLTSAWDGFTIPAWQFPQWLTRKIGAMTDIWFSVRSSGELSFDKTSSSSSSSRHILLRAIPAMTCFLAFVSSDSWPATYSDFFSATLYPPFYS